MAYMPTFLMYCRYVSLPKFVNWSMGKGCRTSMAKACAGTRAISTEGR